MKTLMMAAALAVLAAGAAQAQQTVRLGTEGAYPPYNFINDKGEVDGYERELGDMMCERAGLTCTWVTNDWDSIIPNLQSGNYDAIMAGMSITEERGKIVSFTQNYYPPGVSAYMALSDDVDVTSGVVAAQTSTIQAGYVAESGATLLEFATADETVAAVRNGEADAVFADKDFLVPVQKESNGEFVWAAEDVVLGGGVGMAFRQSDTELKDKFDAVITEMKEDGTINKLLAKWFADAEEVPQY
ncbi:transporter substrate-binding domain-containing protein [Frigidibacter sp. MR17.24]|uniref:transporter substrate-binding domain-containing protein n=1 Tax=Frigidibacter sp. MR17.24 TaxID=3127345 RepID=UPI0030131D19